MRFRPKFSQPEGTIDFDVDRVCSLPSLGPKCPLHRSSSCPGLNDVRCPHFADYLYHYGGRKFGSRLSDAEERTLVEGVEALAQEEIEFVFEV